MGNGLMPWLRRAAASCALSWLLPAADGPPTQISGSKGWGKVMATDGSSLLLDGGCFKLREWC